MEIIRKTAQSMLGHLTKNNPDVRPVIVDEGAIPCLVELSYYNTLVDQGNATDIILNVAISCPETLLSNHNLIHALSHALTHQHFSVVYSATTIVFRLLIVEGNRSVVGSNREIVNALISIVRTRDSPDESVRETLKALLMIALCPPNRAGLLELGALAALFAVVGDNRRVGMVEEVTTVIAELVGTKGSPTAFRGVLGNRVLVDLLNMESIWSEQVRENSIHGLLNLAERL